MSRPRLYLIFLITGLAFGVVACDSGEKKDPKEILKVAPFKSITDSINRFPDQPELYLSRAMRLSQHNRLELATADYQKTWELTQDPGVALEYISNLLLVNKVQTAYQLLTDCIQRFPDNPDFRRRLAEMFAETGNTAKALEQYDSLLVQDPENFEGWYDKGNLLARVNDTTGAIQALEKSFQLQPVTYSGLALATLYSYRKDPRALEICDFLIARDSTSTRTDALFAKGLYYTETQQFDKAIEQFNTCIKLDWKLTDAYIEKGIIYYKQTRYDSALSIFNLSVTVSNTNADGYYWTGRTYEAMGDREKAVQNYERALSLDNNFPEAARRLRDIRNKP